jgi:hypothetical protein
MATRCQNVQGPLLSPSSESRDAPPHEIDHNKQTTRSAWNRCHKSAVRHPSRVGAALTTSISYRLVACRAAVVDAVPPPACRLLHSRVRRQPTFLLRSARAPSSTVGRGGASSDGSDGRRGALDGLSPLPEARRTPPFWRLCPRSARPESPRAGACLRRWAPRHRVR